MNNLTDYHNLTDYLVYPIIVILAFIFTFLTVPPGLGWLELVAVVAGLAGCAIAHVMQPANRVSWLLLSAVIAAAAIFGYFVAIFFGTPGILVTAALTGLVLLIFLPTGLFVKVAELYLRRN